MNNLYLWLKAIHIFGVICWFAGIFYLPRLLVNHVMIDNQSVKQHLELMAAKLYRFMTGLMYLALIAGGSLMLSRWDAFGTALWLYVKIAIVAALVTYHITCGHYIKELINGTCQRSEKYFRLFNEVPVILLILVILLVVLRPF